MAKAPKQDKNRLQKFGTGKIVVGAVDRAVVQRWDQARERAAATSGTVEERIEAIEAAFRKELVALGAAAGGAAAVPGVGTMTAIGLTASEIAWTATRTTDLILTVAAVHGLTDASADQRKAWVLSIMAFDDGAATGFAALATEMGGTVAASRTVSVEVLDKMNGRLARMIIARVGAKQSALVFGKFLPFGIGALVGGAANHLLVNTMIERSHRFFAEVASWRLIPPPAIEPPRRPLP